MLGRLGLSDVEAAADGTVGALLGPAGLRPARLPDCFGALIDYADAAGWGKTPMTREAAARRVTETPAAA